MGDRHTYPEMAPAGLWTTPSDLAVYILEVQQSLKGKANHVLSASMTTSMLTKQLGDQGLGPVVEKKDNVLVFAHSGANAGYRCQFYALTNADQGVVIMTNSDRGMDLIRELMRSVANAYGWPTVRSVTKKIALVNPEQLDRLVGKYQGKGNGNVVLEITRQDNGLQVRQGWDNYRFALFPESDLTFFVKDDGRPFSFETAADGSITGLLAFGQDRWTRIK